MTLPRRNPRLTRGVATVTLGLFGLAGGLFSGCGDSSDEDSCVSTREYFANEILGGAMKSCAGCHEPGGLASEQFAEFRLWPATYPGFIDENLENVRKMASTEFNGVPLLLAKPTGMTDHGGGKVLSEDSEEYEKIQKLIEQLDDPEECADEGQGSEFEGVTLLSYEDTLRKASLHLVGRLPTDDELAVVAAGDTQLALLLEGMMDEDAFFVRLEEMFNDIFLTDRYLAYTGFAVNLLDTESWPAAAQYDLLPDDQKYVVNYAVAREPLDLIAYIVKNDRPFTEVLTADYMIFNPYTAAIYQPAGVSFGQGATYSDLVEGQLSVAREGAVYNVPHAGILTSPMFLNRFPTTGTNRNRHRARMVLNLFLATDILKIAERPIDPAAPTNYNNPTREDPKCAVCHSMIDPIAGGFQKYDDNDQEDYDPNKAWYTDMFTPGFNGEDMSTGDYPQATQWLAARVAKDPRFVISTVYTMYRALTGLQPLAFPTDLEDPDYKAKLSAWYAQDALFTDIGEQFVMDDYNLKTVISGIVRSPYFRATDAEMLDGAAQAEYAALGGGRLSTPELLARKIAAVTGARWVRTWDLADYMTSDYRILYGGIDSDTITRRLTSMNGIMASVAWRMANEVSCGVTAWDFTKPAEARTLFPKVELTDLPEGVSGDPVPDAIERIKTNIVHLHRRVLGEELTIDDPEIERTYQIFYETWKEGVGLLAGGQVNEWLDWQCQGRVDPNTQLDLPDGEKIEQDPFYTVRAWMAVMTYLLSDYKFLYE
ncbi:MAG: DUF1588 domain-containing protein [Myxococcales bacterium]|nr:DUF1588 domain-containing protein [Myxococcales bacterium]